MRSITIIAPVLMLVSCSDSGAPPTETAAAPVAHAVSVEPTPAPAPIGVDELMKNVDNYRGRDLLVVDGIVSAAAQGRVSLIDCGEWDKCGVITCAELTLPVEWAGTPPQLKQRVRLHGQVRESGGKLLFAAETLETVETRKGEGS